MCLFGSNPCFFSGIVVCWSPVLFLKEKVCVLVSVCVCVCVFIPYTITNSESLRNILTCKLNAYKTNDEMKQILSDVATGRIQWWWIRHTEIHEIRISTEVLCIVKTYTESNVNNFIMKTLHYSLYLSIISLQCQHSFQKHCKTIYVNNSIIRKNFWTTPRYSADNY